MSDDAPQATNDDLQKLRIDRSASPSLRKRRGAGGSMLPRVLGGGGLLVRGRRGQRKARQQVFLRELGRGQENSQPLIGCELPDGLLIRVRAQRTVCRPPIELFDFGELHSVCDNSVAAAARGACGEDPVSTARHSWSRKDKRRQTEYREYEG